MVLETRILVVEDERALASFIEQGLLAEGHAVTVCHDGERGEAAALTGDYALVLLDLLCSARPASTCLERSPRCRNRPVIVLTVRAAVEQKGVSTEALSQAGFLG